MNSVDDKSNVEQPLEIPNEGAAAQAYKSRTRYNSTKTPTFEGIDEENEDLTSDSSAETATKITNPELVKPTSSESEKKEDVGDESTIDNDKTIKSNDQIAENASPQIENSASDNSYEDLEVNQRSILKNSNKNGPVLGRHLSFDSPIPNSDRKTTGSLSNISTKPEDDKDAIDKYYERNNYTITGIYEKNQDTFRNLPDYLRRDLNRRQSVSQKSVSRCSYTKPEPTSGYQAKKRFRKSFYFLLHNTKRMGFRHIMLLLIVLAYTMAGAAFFYYVESRYELETVIARKGFIDDTIFKLASEITGKINDPLISVNDTTMQEYIRSAYIKLLTLESAYEGSTLYKAEDPEKNFKWTFGSAFFFSMNLYTTTGYGSIAAATNLGRLVTIIYGFVFVPLTLVVIRDMGQLTLVYLTKLYAIILWKLRTARGYSQDKEDEIISLPIKVALVILAVYLFLASVFVYEYDAISGPPGSGLDFFTSFYFSFISLTTIGLGDIMPNNVPFAPIVSIVFFFGLPIMKVVNRVTYICLENGVFATMTVLENRIDQFLGSAFQPETQDPERGPVPVIPIQVQPSDRRASDGSIQPPQPEAETESEIPNEWINNFTIRSIATFMRSSGDVYGGGFGRVNLRRSDFLTNNCQDTVRSSNR